MVERVLGKDEVTGSIPVPGSRFLGEACGAVENAVEKWIGGVFLQMLAENYRNLKLGGGNSTVESHSSKVMVAGSNPVPRSKDFAVRFGVRR